MSRAGELLAAAIEAHGGPEQWREVRHIVIRARSGGIALPLRFKPAAFKQYEANITAHKPGADIIPFAAKEAQPFEDLGDNDCRSRYRETDSRPLFL